MAKTAPAAAAPKTAPAAADTVVDPLESAMPQRHTYPDGSEVVGQPPWPEQSPKQREQEQKRLEAEAMGEGTRIPAGAGEEPASRLPVGIVTAEDLAGNTAPGNT